MTAFAKCLQVEQQSKEILRPYVILAYGHPPVEIPKDYDSQTGGDWKITDANRGDFEFAVELKAEEVFTGNLFLEAVSNANVKNANSVRYGWFWTSRAWELWYHFLQGNLLYTVQLGRLRQWFAPESDGPGAPINRLRLLSQGKHEQHNLTQGYAVPISLLLKSCPTFKEVKLNGVIQ